MVESALEYGWYSASERRSLPLTGDNAWDSDGFDSRTAAAFHAWEPIDAFLFAHSFDPASTLDTALDFARQWHELGLSPTGPDLGTAGRRALRLAYLAQATGDPEWMAHAHELADALESQVVVTDISLATTDAVVGLATLNHRLETSGYPTNGLGAAATQAMLAHANAAFTSDGVHRSQSPGIHAQALDRLTMIIQAGSVRHSSLAAHRRRAEGFLAWVLDPTGAPANIADTTTTPITKAYTRQPSGLQAIPGRVRNRALRHALTGGRFGAPPGNPMEVFDEGGFAVIKVPWPHQLRGTDAPSHLVMRTDGPHAAARNHGPVITWHDRGLRLLVEPGPSPEHPDHPAAGYARQADAHNTVIVADAPSSPRTAEIVTFGSHRNRYFVATHTMLDTGTHDRTLVLDPGRWLLVLDRVDGVGDRGVGVRFHSGDELDLMSSGSGFTLLRGAEPVAWAVPLAHTSPMVAERGQVEPHPSGWWSPDGFRMVPNWVFGWDAQGSTTFATVISLDGRPTPERLDAPWIGWRADGYRVRVAVTEWGISDVVTEPALNEEVRRHE
jgi:hypothetical protein